MLRSIFEWIHFNQINQPFSINKIQMQPGKSINIAKEAIKYYLNSKTIHHIDSPYVFSLVKTILDSDRKELVFESIELLRNRLIQRTDFLKGQILAVALNYKI